MHMNSRMKRYIGQGPKGSLVLQLLSLEFWVHHPFGMWMYSPTWKLIVSHCSGVFIEFNLQSSPACLPPPFLEVDE